LRGTVPVPSNFDPAHFSPAAVLKANPVGRSAVILDPTPRTVHTAKQFCLLLALSLSGALLPLALLVLELHRLRQGLIWLTPKLAGIVWLGAYGYTGVILWHWGRVAWLVTFGLKVALAASLALTLVHAIVLAARCPRPRVLLLAAALLAGAAGFTWLYWRAFVYA
jgi:hypothetical protein